MLNISTPTHSFVQILRTGTGGALMLLAFLSCLAGPANAVADPPINYGLECEQSGAGGVFECKPGTPGGQVTWAISAYGNCPAPGCSTLAQAIQAQIDGARAEFPGNYSPPCGIVFRGADTPFPNSVYTLGTLSGQRGTVRFRAFDNAGGGNTGCFEQPQDAPYPASWNRPVTCEAPWEVEDSGRNAYCRRPAVECPFCKKNKQLGNPIELATAAKVETQVDYAAPGAFALRFERTYNSHGFIRPAGDPVAAAINSSYSGFGVHWRHNYDRRVVAVNSPATLAYVVNAHGEYKTFFKSASGWVGRGYYTEALVELLDGAGARSGWRYTMSDDVVEQYDANGRPVLLTSRSGLQQSFVYADGTASGPNGGIAVDSPAGAPFALQAGLPLRVTDSFGRSLTFAYLMSGQLDHILDPNGNSIGFTYDVFGQLKTINYPDTRTRTYLYASDDNPGTQYPFSLLTGIVDENHTADLMRYALFTYDTAFRPYSTEHAGGVEKYVISDYSWAGGLPRGSAGTINVQVSDPFTTASTRRLKVVNGVYRDNGDTFPCGTPGCSGTVSTSLSYDVNGNVASNTDFNGNQTCYGYDLTRNLETTRIEGLTSGASCATALAATSLPAPARRIATTWHSTFRIPVTITEPTTAGNKVTTYTHDANGNVLTRSVTVDGTTRTWTYTYDQFGRVLTASDPRNNTTTNSYYANTAAQGVNRGMLASVTNAAGHTTSITSYNAHGQPLSITDANGLTTTMAYDARQRMTGRTVGGESTIYDYDGVGQLKKVTLPDSSFLNYTYDAAHRLTQIQDGLGNRVIYTLDNMGNRVKEDYADPANVLTRTRSRVYDALNRLQQDIGGATPATQISQYSYDNNGNQTGMTDPLNRSTTQSYDALNRLLQVVDPFNGAAAPTKYEYDAQDNLTKVTDPKNLATVYTYNGFNELTNQSSPDTGATNFTYDNAGNLQTKIDARGVTATYSYDALNRVGSISYPAYQSDPAETVSYGYDTCSNGKGRLCSITDKTGTTTYSYDIRGRALSKAQTVAGLTQTIGYGYNAAGQMNSMTLPSGKIVTYAYLNNRITGVTYDGQPIVKNADYEPFGPVGEWAWGNDSVANPNKHTRFFDLDGRNTKIESGPTTGSIEPTLIVYDAASRITDLQKLTNNVIDPTKSATYGYDNLDRLTAVSPNAGNTNPTRGYSYDGVGNRLTSTIASATTSYGYGSTSHRLDSLSGAITKSYSYDADGNRTADGTTTWSYGGNNRPISIAIPGGTPVTIQAGINALGQRVTKTVNGTLTRFVYDEGGRLIGEYDNTGKAKQETLWFNDLPVAVIK